MADNEYKVILIGDSFVGKTSLIARYSSGSFCDGETPTIAASYTQFCIDVEKTPIKLNVWDTAGHEKFRCIVPMYARTAEGMIVVFDLSKPNTFEGAKEWHKKILDEVDGIPVIFLCGNKLDQVTDLNVVEYENWASNNGVHFITTSALMGTNVKELFESVAKHLKNLHMKNNIIENGEISLQVSSPKKSSCC